MVRQTTGKHGSTRIVFVSIGAALLFIGLVADFFWASSSRSTLSISNTWSSDFHLPTFPSHLNPPLNSSFNPKPKEKNVKKSNGGRVLSATFSDLPGPQLEWDKMTSAPVPRLDGASVQINNLLYVFAGYGTIDYVNSHVDIFNFTDNTWGGRFDMPKEMAHSHLGMTTDGRYIYAVTGQYGPQCRGPIANTFILDTETKKWSSRP